MGVVAVKLGILGGTFDPIHFAHLAVAEEVRERLGLTEVLFIPTGLPWLKLKRHVTPAEHRVEMVRLAIAGKPYFKLSTIDIGRPGLTYTLDTIRDLKGQFGAAELLFIIGWDSLAELPYWREPGKLIQECKMVAVRRPGVAPPDLAELEKQLPGVSQQVIVLDRPEMDISSSDIRQRVAWGLPIDKLVPEAVERYIREKRLYRSR